MKNPKRGFGDLGIWGFGDLEIWRFGDLEIWRFGDLKNALKYLKNKPLIKN